MSFFLNFIIRLLYEFTAIWQLTTVVNNKIWGVISLHRMCGTGGNEKNSTNVHFLRYFLIFNIIVEFILY